MSLGVAMERGGFSAGKGNCLAEDLRRQKVTTLIHYIH